MIRNALATLVVGFILIAGLVFGLTISKEAPQQPVGAIATDKLNSSQWTVNGVTHYYQKQAFIVATTTPCSLRSPGATSTLVSASSNWRTASTSQLEVGKALTRYATTTQIGDIAALTNLAQDVVVASTSPADSTMTFGPNQFLVFKTGGVAVTTNSPVGYCQAEWILL